MVDDRGIEMAQPVAMSLTRPVEASAADADTELIVRFQAGDGQAFRPLYQRHSPAVYRLALRMTGSTADAEDITQVVFERVWHALGRFRTGEAQLSTWLYRVAANACLDHLKSAPRRRERGLEPEVAARQADVGRSPEAQLAADQTRSRIEQALLALPEKYRVVVVLRDIEERSYEEIRAILELPITTLKMRAVRGREKLAAVLERGERR
jgi:RNA polymerase sigma-70 factor (ECF subfamily)